MTVILFIVDAYSKPSFNPTDLYFGTFLLDMAIINNLFT